jgi:hypothetical protein
MMGAVRSGAVWPQSLARTTLAAVAVAAVLFAPGQHAVAQTANASVETVLDRLATVLEEDRAAAAGQAM